MVTEELPYARRFLERARELKQQGFRKGRQRAAFKVSLVELRCLGTIAYGSARLANAAERAAEFMRGHG